MPIMDNSDNPYKGFELIHHPEGLYVRCRGRSCYFNERIRRVIHLEVLLKLVADHRVECNRPVQLVKVPE